MLRGKQATVEFASRWRSAQAHQVERLYYERINFWRDFCHGLPNWRPEKTPHNHLPPELRFSDLHTESNCVPSCPADDHANQLLLSDPVYAVWGRAT